MSKCEGFPIVRFTWPGKDEAYACMEHAKAIKHVAGAMGLPLQMIPLRPMEMIEVSCDSKVKDEEEK